MKQVQADLGTNCALERAPRGFPERGEVRKAGRWTGNKCGPPGMTSEDTTGGGQSVADSMEGRQTTGSKRRGGGNPRGGSLGTAPAVTAQFWDKLAPAQ